MNKNRKTGIAYRDYQGKKVVGYIYEESDYSIFKKMEANRSVKNSRKNKVVSSIREKDLAMPIAVTPTMEIFDGQATFEARKELGLPILYYFTPGDVDIEDCRRLNSLNSNWTSVDFVDSFADEGNENYIRLKAFMDEHQITMSIIKTFIGYGPRKSNLLTLGDFIFTEKEEDMVLDLYTKSEEIIEALDPDEKPNQTFYKAVKVIVNFGGYNHKRMLNNCRKYRNKYAQQAGLESQLKVFSGIYNASKQKDKLYFEDYMRNKGYSVRTYDSVYQPWLGARGEEDISSLGRGAKK